MASKAKAPVTPELETNGRLPKGWRMARFDELAQMVNERVDPSETDADIYVGLEHLDSDTLKIRRWGTPSDVIGDKLRFRTGDIIFGRRRAYQRKLAVAEFDGICSAHAMVVRASTETVDPEFLPFLMQSDLFMQRAIDISVGSLSPTINWKTLRIQEFPLPPKDEQRRIAEILWAADEYLESLRATLEAIREVRRRTLLAAYRNGFGHTEYVATPIGPRPFCWRVAELQEFYEVQLGKMISPKSRDGEFQRPYIRNANVQWNRLELDDVATMSFSPSELPRFELRYGDILACEGRHVGKSAIWRNEVPGACYQKALHRLRPRDSHQVPEFMLYQMEFASLTGVFSETTGETTIPHLPAERLRTILFSFPPQPEQRAIADRISAIDDAVSHAESHIAATKALSSQLLSRRLMGVRE
ncbi:MAG: restriction endonuclease subunit S [Planctomycetaceae bacterium]